MTVLPVGTRRRMMRNPRGWIAAGFGAGFSPIAPGTVGSIVAILPWWLWMHDLAPRDYAAVQILACVVGVGPPRRSSR